VDETWQEISVCNRLENLSSNAYSRRCPNEVPVKTDFGFGAVFTGSRACGRLEELLVEIRATAVEKEGKTSPFFQ
jgi:hypothetical protein